MKRILVTGSADGIGLQTARTLLELGHSVVLHARSAQRAGQVRELVPDAAGVVIGDVSSLTQTRVLAEQAVDAGPFDVVIHNVGVRVRAAERAETEDGLELSFQANVLAPYLLTALLPRPARLVYLASAMQAQGVAQLDDLQFERRTWDGVQAYSDSKLYDVALAFAVARRWPGVISNTVDPGWIKTRMGGPGATDPLPEGAETQVWLATSDEPDAVVSGRYLRRRQVMTAHPAAGDPEVQEQLLAECARLTGVKLPD